MKSDVKAVREWLRLKLNPPDEIYRILDNYEAMEKALEFYAGTKTVLGPCPDQKPGCLVMHYQTVANYDHGELAREALRKVRGEKE